ncbi:CHAT domain-containing protein [Lactarius psammicola]|nr:CHAT domain-containing protein [Lactarius psammicola]
MDPEFSIADIDDRITLAQNVLSLRLFPRHDHTHINCVHILAGARFERYTLSRQKEDLDKSILHYTEAIFLPPVSRAQGSSINVVYLLFRLAMALLDRSKFERPEDIKCSINFHRYLRRLPPDSFDVPRIYLTTSLIQALAAQVESEAGDGTQSIDEMVVLCRELLTSEISAGFPTAAFTSLNDAVNTEFDRGISIQLLNKVVECLRDAVKVCPPGSYNVLYALADVLYTRFLETHSSDDYDEATVLLERILDPNHSGECPASTRVLASSLSTLLAFTRSTIFKTPESSEVAISHLRASLGPSSIDDGLHLQFTESLAIQASLRFTDYSLAESREEANSCISDVQNIQRLEEQLSNTPPGTSHHKRRISELAKWYKVKFSRTNDISDIEESVKYGRLLLNATHSNDPWRANPLNSLLDILLLAFEHTNKVSYLDESIILGYDILNLKSARDTHFYVISQLVSSLLTRSRLLDRGEDKVEVLRLIPLAINDQYAQEADKFLLSCVWAQHARRMGHPSVLTAYKSAMSLVQRSLSFAPTVSIQHTRLVSMSGGCHKMPLDYASYQIDLGQFEEAIETLEQGRALLWSEMRGLRTPIAQLAEEDPPLAKRFSEINEELEGLTISMTPSGRPEIEDDVAQGGDCTDPFGRLVVKQQNLVEERDALISQIQGRPGLEGFLKTPSFITLRSAASRGPVILINHCRWRSDILILFHDSRPCIIPTADDFYLRANNLRDELVEARKHGLDSAEYQDALSSVLKGLYKLVGGPVIEKLRVLGVPEQSRVWWCPTSVFCSLPLHAMGPIPSYDTSERYFSDLYIPSYTPSLSALIESRKANPQTLDKPSFLLVAQPDGSLPGVWGEMEVVQSLNAQVTNLILNAATPTSVIEGLRGSRFVHFACHGELETGKPFEASFKLHGGSHLTLLDIVQSRLPDAEFALLSCCHTAEITEDSIADEALHLTAAMQYCGFRSVVGTLWAMADTDGRDLAKSFYKSLFSGRGADIPYHERSARALRDATRKLRKKRGISLERWGELCALRCLTVRLR